MYIRRTQTRNKNNGDAYYTYRLVCSKRVGQKVRQVTLLNLGRHFDIEQKHWPALCARIDQLLSAEPSLFAVSCSKKVEHKAHQIVQQLLLKQRIQEDASEVVESSSASSAVLSSPDVSSACGASPASHPPAADMQLVDISTLQSAYPRSVGTEHLSLWSMAQVDFDGILQNLGFNAVQRSAAFGSIVGRMVRPASENATYTWLCQHSALGELLDVDYSFGSNAQLYRVSDLLLKHRNAIESMLFEHLHSLFGLECTITLYDLTNTYMEGAGSANPKAKRGHSKEKRSDCPLVTLGLVLDGSGFVRRSEVFAGNAREDKTLEQMLKDLRAPMGALVVMDRGIATEDNIQWLRDQGYRYIVVSRQQSRQFDYGKATSITNARGDTINLEKRLSEDGKEVLLHCYSERRAEKEKGINERFAKAFEEKLQAMHEGLSKPRTIKKLDRVHERIGRLKERSRGIHQHYAIEVSADESGTVATAITWKQQPKAASMMTHPGVYCLRSSETDWSEEQLWNTYSMLTDLEAVFRSLKSELGMRPVFHQKEERTDGHLFITVLAYQFVQIIRHKLKEQGIHDSWSSLRQTMGQQCRITTIFQRADGHSLHVRKATTAEESQRRIYRALGLDMAPGGVKKIIA